VVALLDYLTVEKMDYEMVLLKGYSWAEMMVEETVGKKVVMMVLSLAGTTDSVVVDMLEHATVENLVASSADSWV
jgi:hypothetical protein